MTRSANGVASNFPFDRPIYTRLVTLEYTRARLIKARYNVSLNYIILHLAKLVEIKRSDATYRI